MKSNAGGGRSHHIARARLDPSRSIALLGEYIQQLGEERYTGYVWAGAWGQNLLSYAGQLGMLK